MVIAALACASQMHAQSSSRKSSLTIEQLIEIKHPSDPVWSPDGKRVAFFWAQEDIRNLFVANADGSGQPAQLTSFPEGGVAGAFWSEDGDSVYFVHESDLWQVPAAGGTPKPAWSKPDRGSGFVPSRDSRRVAFVRGNPGEGEGAQRGGDLIIRWLSDGKEATTAHDDVSIRGIVWSPDGKSIAYTGGSKIIHHDGSPEYSERSSFIEFRNMRRGKFTR
jgi:Tol biopolymer transport system component